MSLATLGKYGNIDFIHSRFNLIESHPRNICVRNRTHVNMGEIFTNHSPGRRLIRFCIFFISRMECECDEIPVNLTFRHKVESLFFGEASLLLFKEKLFLRLKLCPCLALVEYWGWWRMVKERWIDCYRRMWPWINYIKIVWVNSF